MSCCCLLCAILVHDLRHFMFQFTNVDNSAHCSLCTLMCVTILYPVEGKIDLIHFTDRLRSMREGYVLTRVCPSIHPSVCPHLGGWGGGYTAVGMPLAFTQEDFLVLKWHSLNSLNSVNKGKMQKQYGYQRQFMSGNRYIPRYSGKKDISITVSGMWWDIMDI